MLALLGGLACFALLNEYN